MTWEDDEGGLRVRGVGGECLCCHVSPGLFLYGPGEEDLKEISPPAFSGFSALSCSRGGWEALWLQELTSTWAHVQTWPGGTQFIG